MTRREGGSFTAVWLAGLWSAPATRDANGGFSVHHKLALDRNLTAEDNAGGRLINRRDGDPGQGQISDPNRFVEIQGLAEIDRTRSGQDRADDGGAE